LFSRQIGRCCPFLLSVRREPIANVQRPDESLGRRGRDERRTEVGNVLGTHCPTLVQYESRQDRATLRQSQQLGVRRARRPLPCAPPNAFPVRSPPARDCWAAWLSAAPRCGPPTLYQSALSAESGPARFGNCGERLNREY
jgi:hypothetical protein